MPMPGEIKHTWVGTTLIIESDSGTSAADLKGRTGDIGPRGPQGPAGVVYNQDGEIVMEGYATEQYVQDLVNNVNVDLTGVATEDYVNQQIAKIPQPDLSDYATNESVDEKIAAIPKTDLSGYATEEYVDTQITNVATGGSIDLVNYATKDYVATAIQEGGGSDPDGITIIKDNNGKLTSAIGGGYIANNYYLQEYPNETVGDGVLADTLKTGYMLEAPFDSQTPLTFEIFFGDGVIDTITGTLPAGAFTATSIFTCSIQVISSDTTYINSITAICNYKEGEGRNFSFVFQKKDGLSISDVIVSQITMTIGSSAGAVYLPINAKYIPVDGTTIIIKDGKLTAVGGTSLASSEEVYY
jgi:hypothetical protein